MADDRDMDKLTIAGTHAEAALRLMAVGGHPFSVHVLVMACSELIGTIAKHRDVTLPLSFDHMIRDDRKSEWRKATVSAYNFFKHADRDTTASMKDEDVQRIASLNDLTMIANITHLQTLGFDLHPAFASFRMSIGLIYPEVVKWDVLDALNPDMAAARERLGPVSRPFILKALRYSLIDHGLLPSDDRF